jgi:hypothetical protein
MQTAGILPSKTLVADCDSFLKPSFTWFFISLQMPDKKSTWSPERVAAWRRCIIIASSKTGW